MNNNGDEKVRVAALIFVQNVSYNTDYYDVAVCGNLIYLYCLWMLTEL